MIYPDLYLRWHQWWAGKARYVETVGSRPCGNAPETGRSNFQRESERSNPHIISERLSARNDRRAASNVTARYFRSFHRYGRWRQPILLLIVESSSYCRRLYADRACERWIKNLISLDEQADISPCSRTRSSRSCDCPSLKWELASVYYSSILISE